MQEVSTSLPVFSSTTDRAVDLDRVAVVPAKGSTPLGTFPGGPGDDTLTGTVDADLIEGFGGNDTIFGDDGSDTLYGGDGDDVFRYAVAGDHGDEDLIDGGAGIDRIEFEGLLSFGMKFVTVASIEEIAFVYSGTAGGLISANFSGQQFSAPGGFATDLVVDATGNTDPGTQVRLEFDMDAADPDIDISGWSFLGWNANLSTGDQVFLRAGDEDNTIIGSQMDDLVVSRAGDDHIVTGDGNDRVTTEGGDNHVDTGAGDDSIFAGGPGSNTFIGGEGDDRIIATGGTARVVFGPGADFFDVGSGGTVDGAATDFAADAGFDLTAGTYTEGGLLKQSWIGFEHYDNAASLLGAEFVIGTALGNEIATGGGDNSIDGGDGDDTISAGAGNDTIEGGNGNDGLFGGDGNDSAAGKSGDDTIHGEAGDDILQGGSGADEIYGGIGADNVFGGFDDDIVMGGEGDDLVSGNTGDDSIHGDAGDDVLRGVKGFDVMFGGIGDDILKGGGGNDSIFGGDGNDKVKAGAGDDLIVDGDGFDKLRGGNGADTFDLDVDGFEDKIADWEDGLDLLKLDGFAFTDLVISDLKPGKVLIEYGSDTVKVQDGLGLLTAADFTIDDFI